MGCLQGMLKGLYTVISCTSLKSKEQSKNRQQLEAKIKVLEQQLFRDGIAVSEKKLLLKAQYEKESADRASSSLRLNQSFYQKGEKTGNLAWQIKQLDVQKT